MGGPKQPQNWIEYGGDRFQLVDIVAPAPGQKNVGSFKLAPYSKHLEGTLNPHTLQMEGGGSIAPFNPFEGKTYKFQLGKKGGLFVKTELGSFNIMGLTKEEQAKTVEMAEERNKQLKLMAKQKKQANIIEQEQKKLEAQQAEYSAKLLTATKEAHAKLQGEQQAQQASLWRRVAAGGGGTTGGSMLTRQQVPRGQALPVSARFPGVDPKAAAKGAAASQPTKTTASLPGRGRQRFLSGVNDILRSTVLRRSLGGR